MRARSSLFLLLILCPLSALAQTPAIPRAGETIEVSIVNVDTIVTDKHGNRVRGLRKEDFEIFENGVRQPISNFAEYASANKSVTSKPVLEALSTPSAPAAAPLPPPPLP